MVSSVTDGPADVFECSSKWFNVKVRSQFFLAKVDTEAEAVVISKSTAKSLGLTLIRKCNTTVNGYTGKLIPILDKVDLEISVMCTGSPKMYVETFYVVYKYSISILGMSAIHALKLLPAIAQVSSDSSSVTCDDINAKYSHVFEGVGTK